MRGSRIAKNANTGDIELYINGEFTTGWHGDRINEDDLKKYKNLIEDMVNEGITQGKIIKAEEIKRSLYM